MRIIALVFALLMWGCIKPQSQQKTSFYSPTSDSIRIVGRVDHKKDSVTLFWSATTITAKFKGKSLKVMLRDEHGKNYFNVVIDGDSLYYFKPDSLKHFYTLAENLKEGTHTVELIKRNEWDRGKTWFYGVEVEDGTLVALPPKNKRVIEFFGNSITAGYAIADTTGGDSPEGTFTNNYDTYAAITARHFKAEYYCTVKSGIGIMVSWFPLIMPEMYNRLDPLDSLSRWDFKKVTPDVVVVNLFQNDSWIVKLPEQPSFKARFGKKAPTETQTIEAYRSFIQKLRSVYPNAHIVCALGSMDATKEGSPWPSYVEKAVNQLQDQKIYTLFFPYTKKNGHPRKEDNAVMAEKLIGFIEKNIQW